MQFRKHFGYDTEAASKAAEFPIDKYGLSMTIQEHALDCDVNELMRRFRVTGQLPVTAHMPEYGDYTGVVDYKTALLAVMDAQDNFMSLPAKVRAQFDNDPQLFLDFASNPDNIDSLREMGLAKAKELSNGVSQGSATSAGKASAGSEGAAGASGGGDGSVASGRSGAA